MPADRTNVNQPSTGWEESIDPGEDQRHQQFSELIGGIQQRVDRRHGPGRAVHRKQIAGLAATFEVLDDLPDYARHGLFAASSRHDALVRMSNGGITPQSDVMPDIRGLAISVRDVDGPGALGGTTDRQDFLLINRPAFGFRDSRDFAEIVPLAARGQTALVKGLVAAHGVVGGAKAAGSLSKDLARWFTGYATSTFYTAAPLSWGPYAAKVRIVPRQSGFSPRAQLDWAADVNRRVTSQPIIFDVEAQFFVDEGRTPIEDGRQPWPESVAGWLPVAVLTIPVQDPLSAEGIELAARIEGGAFDPWAALAEHRPLGEIMRARKPAYFASQRQRHAASD